MKTIAISLLFCVLPLAVMAQELRLKEQIPCEGLDITFGMLVEEGNAAPFASRRIGDAPRPGQSKSFSLAKLQRQLRDWGWRGHLRGPEKVLASTPGVELSTVPLRVAVLNQLSSLLESDGLRLEGEVKGWEDKISLSNSRIRWTLDLRGKRDFRNRSAELRIEDSLGFCETILLRFHCSMPIEVAVATRDLRKGETLMAWDIEERNAFFIDGQTLGEALLKDAICSRSIEKGETLTKRNLDTGLMVRAGREVEIRLKRGAVTVKIMGIAQADGVLGDRINVRHMDSQELRRYRIVGEGQVAPSYLDNKEETS